MVGLKGCRVIVVDDNEKDALPVLQALARDGIPTAFFKGSPEELPSQEQRLSGVRLAILDMNLVEGGVADKSRISTLVNFLSNLLLPTNGPYAVIAWTYHNELVDAFEDSVFATGGLPKPILTVRVTKSECVTGGAFNLSTVSEKLHTAIREFSPLFLLQEWEERCFCAASEVTNTLAALGPAPSADRKKWRQDWKAEFLRLIYALASEEYGQDLAEGRSALAAFYASLNPLHSDRLENTLTQLSEPLTESASEILTPEAKTDCGLEKKAQLNSMLHIAFEAGSRLWAGSAYSMPEDGAWESLVPSKAVVVRDVSQGGRESEIMQSAVTFLVEVNPICDHAQKKVRMARFAAGLLVPWDSRNLIKKSDDTRGFVYRLGPIYIPQRIAPAGCYELLIDGHYVIALKLEIVADLQPLFRLRRQALTDLISCLANHAARVGLFLLGPPKKTS